MKNYELSLVFPVEKDTQNSKVIDKLKKWLGKDGKVISTDNWGRRMLSYPINKQKEAVYLFVALSLQPEKVQEIDKKLRLEANVLRHMFIHDKERKNKTDKLKSKAKKVKGTILHGSRSGLRRT